MSYSALSDSFEYLCYGSTANIYIFTLTVRGSTLVVRIWRLQLGASISDNLISIPGYQRTLRKGRNRNGGGGTTHNIYCADHIVARRMSDIENVDIKYICLKCFWYSMKLFFSVYYRPFLTSLDISIDLVYDLCADHIIMTRNFNDSCES